MNVKEKNGNVNVWKMCSDICDLFQLAAVIESKVFYVHGGLSPHVNLIDDIRKLDLNKKSQEMVL